MPTPKRTTKKAAKPLKNAKKPAGKPRTVAVTATGQQPETGKQPERGTRPESSQSHAPAPEEPLPRVWMPAYLAALAIHGIKVQAAASASISPRSVCRQRLISPEFAAAEEETMKVVTELCVSEAVRRATQGVRRPVFGSLGSGAGTGQVGEVTEHDNTLLLRVLEWRETGSFRQRQQIETGSPGAFATMADRKAELERARQEMRETGDSRQPPAGA